jgi:hypothetical protein
MGISNVVPSKNFNLRLDACLHASKKAYMNIRFYALAFLKNHSYLKISSFVNEQGKYFFD